MQNAAPSLVIIALILALGLIQIAIGRTVHRLVLAGGLGLIAATIVVLTSYSPPQIPTLTVPLSAISAFLQVLGCWGFSELVRSLITIPDPSTPR
jgi:hypothetical protein